MKIKEIEQEKEIEQNKIEEKYNDNIKMHYDIQRNLSDKLIRNFRRLAYHFSSIQISSYPYEIDEFMHLKLNNEYTCNNDLLNELYQLSLENEKRK